MSAEVCTEMSEETERTEQFKKEKKFYICTVQWHGHSTGLSNMCKLFIRYTSYYYKLLNTVLVLENP